MIVLLLGVLLGSIPWWQCGATDFRAKQAQSDGIILGPETFAEEGDFQCSKVLGTDELDTRSLAIAT
jgi:hypothetical protein